MQYLLFSEGYGDVFLFSFVLQKVKAGKLLTPKTDAYFVCKSTFESLKKTPFFSFLILCYGTVAKTIIHGVILSLESSSQLLAVSHILVLFLTFDLFFLRYCCAILLINWLILNFVKVFRISYKMWMRAFTFLSRRQSSPFLFQPAM